MSSSSSAPSANTPGRPGGRLGSVNRRMSSSSSAPAPSLLAAPAPVPAAAPAPDMHNFVAPAPVQKPQIKHEPTGIVITLQNVVATVNLCAKLDLKKIAMTVRNAEYNPKRFAACIMRIRDPKTTALVFGSGKLVCTGAKSEDDCRTAARKYARILQRLGFPDIIFSDLKIQNICGSCDVKFPLRLEGLASQHASFCTYEPDIFAGLIYRMLEPKVALLIFVSGKVVITGAKKREDMIRAIDNIYPILSQFKKTPSLSVSGPAAILAQAALKAALLPNATSSSSGEVAPSPALNASAPPTLYSSASLFGPTKSYQSSFSSSSSAPPSSAQPPKPFVPPTSNYNSSATSLSSYNYNAASSSSASSSSSSAYSSYDIAAASAAANEGEGDESTITVSQAAEMYAYEDEYNY